MYQIDLSIKEDHLICHCHHTLIKIRR